MTNDEDRPRGFVYASTAYLLWGLLPIYMKALAHIPPMEIIGHRVIWSLPIAGGLLWATRRVGDLKRALHSPRTILMAGATAALISINWGIYVWAIGAGHALDAALGYYINPLFSILLGAVLLRERLSPAQAMAVALAAGAVMVLTLATGRVPVVALGLTLSFGLYAYLKKSLPIGPNQGFFLEVLLLAPFAAAYLAYLAATGRSHFVAGDLARHVTPARLRRGHRRAAPVLRERREAFAPLDDRHHAVHRADDDLPHRRLRLQGRLRRAADDRLPDDLGCFGDLYDLPCPTGAACQSSRCHAAARPVLTLDPARPDAERSKRAAMVRMVDCRGIARRQLSPPRRGGGNLRPMTATGRPQPPGCLRDRDQVAVWWPRARQFTGAFQRRQRAGCPASLARAISFSFPVLTS